MADRPIIFSAPMVLALLAGRLSQTRRVLKDQPSPNEPIGGASPYGQDWVWQHGMDGSIFRQMLPAPPYAPRDRLWVREAWRVDAEWDDCPPREFDGADAIHYEADGAQDTSLWGDPFRPGRLRSPIHMPRWASRLTLLVTDVRVQRLQEISEADARAEGSFLGRCKCMPPLKSGDWFNRSFRQTACFTCGEEFRHLWNSIHGSDAWDANPWVAALTFTVHRCNIDRMEAE